MQGSRALARPHPKVDRIGLPALKCQIVGRSALRASISCTQSDGLTQLLHHPRPTQDILLKLAELGRVIRLLLEPIPHVAILRLEVVHFGIIRVVCSTRSSQMAGADVQWAGCLPSLSNSSSIVISSVKGIAKYSSFVFSSYCTESARLADVRLIKSASFAFEYRLQLRLRPTRWA